MNNKIFTPRFFFVSTLILLAAFSRLIPHPMNFSPLGAIGLFGAAHFSKKWQAFLIPLLATLLSDIFLNNVIYSQYHTSFTVFYEGAYWQYISYILITATALLVFRKVTAPRILVGALSSTVIFFLMSNMGVWVAHPEIYAQNFTGLIACYVAGVPFLKMTLFGDLFYSGVLFGVFYIAQKRNLTFIKI
jgi:hypothetical protein